jgi:hypothetical protein
MRVTARSGKLTSKRHRSATTRQYSVSMTRDRDPLADRSHDADGGHAGNQDGRGFGAAIHCLKPTFGPQYLRQLEHAMHATVMRAWPRFWPLELPATPATQ